MNKNLLRAIERAGLKYRQVTMCNGRAGIMVDTNYDGEHPSAATWKRQAEAKRITKRYPAYTTEPRGHYTAVLIVER